MKHFFFSNWWALCKESLVEVAHYNFNARAIVYGLYILVKNPTYILEVTRFVFGPLGKKGNWGRKGRKNSTEQDVKDYR